MNTPDPDLNNGNDNDNYEHEERAVAPAPAGGALASLAALGTMLSKVDTTAVLGRSGKPMLAFKREGDGTWMFGQKRTVVETGSSWAINPLSFKYGYIAFNDNKVVGERLVSVSQPMPDRAALPDPGVPWTPQWTVDLRCLDGADAGIEVVYKPTTDGGIQAVVGLIEAVQSRFNGGQHNGAVAPIVVLEKDSYPHAAFGKVWVPIMAITSWMPLDGPAPAPEPAAPPPPPPPVEQPRRRRVA